MSHTTNDELKAIHDQLTSTQQREFFARSFIKNQPLDQIEREMGIGPNFEQDFFRSLRAPVQTA
jgi:hypothetical protein